MAFRIGTAVNTLGRGIGYTGCMIDAPPPDSSAPSRRRLLKLGAAGASVVVSIRPALAQTAGSVLTCQIPVPAGGGAVAKDGSVVPAGTKDAFPPAARPFSGEEVKRALGGYQLPGTTYESNQAYLKYIRRLQRGQGGFTCFASLQMPRG